MTAIAKRDAARRMGILLVDPKVLAITAVGTLIAACVVGGSESCSSNNQSSVSLLLVSSGLAAVAVFAVVIRPGQRTGAGRTLAGLGERLLGAIVIGAVCGGGWFAAGGFVLFLVLTSGCPFLNF